MVHKRFLRSRFYWSSSACARNVIRESNRYWPIYLTNWTQRNVCSKLRKLCGCALICLGQLLHTTVRLLLIDFDGTSTSAFVTCILVCSTHSVSSAPSRFFLYEDKPSLNLPLLVTSHEVSLDVRLCSRAHVIIKILLPVGYLAVYKLFLLLDLLLNALIGCH